MDLSARSTRLVAWLALGCHVLVASGLPLPMAAPPRGHVAKDRSRPFPCMDKACGCATAEQCFANCCCHSPAERLAWARAHGVEAAVLAALERRVAPPAASQASCCSTARQESSCCAGAAAPAPDPEAPEVCGDYRSLAADPAAPQDAPADADHSVGPRTVILRDMLACGGILSAWLACGTMLPPPPRVAAPHHDAPAGALALADDVAPSIVADLSTPPPRIA